MLKALLWDVDGTIAETERDGHRVAFNRAFEALDLPWRWDEAHYGTLLAITGGRERLLADMQKRTDAPPEPERDALARALHSRKNALYAEIVCSGAIGFRPGVLALMQQCRAQGVRMGIATTTSRSNLDALMLANLGPAWAERFDCLLCGEDVKAKKPDPEVYRKAVQALQLHPSEAVAVEDAPAGVAAAHAAGLAVVVTRSVYFADAPVDGALAVGPGLHTRQGWQPASAALSQSDAAVGLADIRAWHAAAVQPG